MGQKVHPLGFRLGIYRDWLARWFARDSYGKQIVEDLKIRRFIDASLSKADIARVEIEKTGNNIRIILFSGRPGAVIGKKGQEIDALRTALVREVGNKSNIEISVQEVKNPFLDAMLVAKGIAEQLEGRVGFKRVMKKSATETMRAGAKGIKICCSGRLGGAEIARSEWTRVGSIPLHTLRSDVDYALAEARTTYGMIGVKVWICRGEYQHN